MVGLLSLPEEVLEMIAAKTAKRLSWYEENWGGAAASCKRLHNVQLPNEYVIVEGVQSLPWLVPRLKHAKVLRITSSSTFDTLAVRLPQNEIASRLQRASCDLPGLQVLALRLGRDNEVLIQSLACWVARLLTSASSLHTLDYDVQRFPCPPSLGNCPLKHLSIIMPKDTDLTHSLECLSCCQLLESLRILTVRGPEHCRLGTHPKLPFADLRSLTRLRHVQLVSFAPGKGRGMALPPDCALRLYANAALIERWSERGIAGREAVTALCVWPTENPVPRAWPEGLEMFTALQLLELDCLHLKEALDLSIFSHIPCINICSSNRLTVNIPKGSWQLLQLEGRRWKVTFADLHSFVRSVSVFAFTFPSACTQFAEQIAKACHKASVPLHKQQHTQCAQLLFGGDDPSSTRQTTKLSNDERFVGATRSDSALLLGIWQADPIKQALSGLAPFP